MGLYPEIPIYILLRAGTAFQRISDRFCSQKESLQMTDFPNHFDPSVACMLDRHVSATKSRVTYCERS